uniref:Sesquiterpene synthase 5 n=1 Tax=Valeriana officinalis TaxID=19953 RepID=L0HNI1_VALOF|nr:sesquiterpene synthase 5 [Valeriana officinalis]
MDFYIQASGGPLSPEQRVPQPIRRTANYHPSIWGNYFLKYASTDCVQIGDHDGAEELEEVRRKLVADGNDDRVDEQLKLIDAIQRLGVAYHFESEIDVVLNRQLLKLSDSFGNTNPNVEDDDLYMVSLRFRLLRQQGHPVSCGVFSKFTDNEGRFKESIVSDVRGMLSLYEAAHMRVREEDILEEALNFSTTHLKQVVNKSLRDHALISQVVHALNWPIRKTLARLEARNYMQIYEQEKSHDETLLKFAKLDFNMLQKVHQRELGVITRWWSEFNVAEKLPFARDRLVECYIWILGVYFEPHYRLARSILTKVIVLASVIDDIYDVYGTIEELLLFTDAIQRWDIDDKNEMPEYMSHIYGTLLAVYSEMEEELSKQEASFRVDYAKQAMKELTKAYFDEANLYDKSNVPKVEEYMKVALVSSGYMMLATTSLVGMGVLASEDAFEWVSGTPLIVRASCTIARLMDDMVGHESEQERGDVASIVECYMKEHGATKEETYVELNTRIADAWKDINQECLCPTAVPMVLLDRILNQARVIYLLYKDEDCYTNSKTRAKDIVTSLLIERVPI